jgi:lysophospholipase L1-like esterase
LKSTARGSIARYHRADVHPLFGKTSRAIVVMGSLLAVPYLSPRLRVLRVTEAPWDKDPPRAVAAKPKDQPLSVGEATLSASKNEATVDNALPATQKQEDIDPQVLAKAKGSLAIEDETGHAMDAFYTHLAATLRKDEGAVTRVLHYGDSLITSDLISGTMRRRMQARFGDAGHGFILVANPWDWYFHNDVAHSASDGWAMTRITGPLNGDGLYGLGGVSFRATADASATFATATKGDYGTKASRFDVYYLEQPGGGGFSVHPKGGPSETVATAGPKKVARVHSVHVPDGAASLTIRSWGEGARLFGVAIERDVPGVVYDALGVNGARMKLLESMSARGWAEQLDLRKPALVILQYGTNETVAGVLDPEYEKTFLKIVDEVKAGAPDASILVCAPLDRGEKRGSDIRTMPIVPKLVAAQRSVAYDEKVAFWNTFEAMGGAGAMEAWVHASPQLATWDLTHPTPDGAEKLGEMLYAAILVGYQAWQQKHPEAPKID